MKKKNKLSLKRVFMFAVILLLLSFSAVDNIVNENDSVAIEETPYYEGKYNSVNYVANLIDKIDKEDILISPFNINSTLAALYNIDPKLINYFQDTNEYVNNYYLSKMNKYKRITKDKTKKQQFYEKRIKEFYENNYDKITIKSFSKIGTIDKNKMIDLLNIITLSEESLNNKNITLKQLKKYKSKDSDYNINNQSIINMINHIIYNYNLYTKENYLINISNLYYNKKYKNLSLDLLKDKYLIDIKTNKFTTSEDIKEINQDFHLGTNNTINYLVDDKDLNSDSLIISSFVFNYKWENIIDRNKNTYDDFYNEDTIISVEMLNFTTDKYLENASAIGFIKDYENNKYSFVGILPKYYHKLSSINLENLLESEKEIVTNISIPKFSILDTNNIMDINKKEIKLSDDVVVDKYYQKNSFTLSEAGTYDMESNIVDENNIATLATVDNVVFNRPFYFLIIDNDNNSVLLAGKLTNPNI